MLYSEVSVYCESHVDHINTLCWKNSEFVIVALCGIYSYHWALKVLSETGRNKNNKGFTVTCLTVTRIISLFMVRS
jgi:hypothetical protein